jgi:hypothetical protein
MIRDLTTFVLAIAKLSQSDPTKVVRGLLSEGVFNEAIAQAVFNNIKTRGYDDYTWEPNDGTASG